MKNTLPKLQLAFEHTQCTAHSQGTTLWIHCSGSHVALYARVQWSHRDIYNAATRSAAKRTLCHCNLLEQHLAFGAAVYASFNFAQRQMRWVGAPAPHLIFSSIIQSMLAFPHWNVEMQEVRYFSAFTQKGNQNVISLKNQVTYSVNADGGYVAEVSYEGTAVFPEVQELFIFFQTLSYISEYL